MTVKFSRSVRSIQADNLIPVLVGISFFALLMLGWMIWFFFAQIPTYTTSTAAVYQQEGYIIAEFAANDIEEIHRGQAAQFQLLTAHREITTIPLIVTDVDLVARRARLILQVDVEAITKLPVGATGQVKVRVKQDSPALFVLRAAGLWPDA